MSVQQALHSMFVAANYLYKTVTTRFLRSLKNKYFRLKICFGNVENPVDSYRIIQKPKPEKELSDEKMEKIVFFLLKRLIQFNSCTVQLISYLV